MQRVCRTMDATHPSPWCTAKGRDWAVVGLTCGEEVLSGLVWGALHAPGSSRRGLGAAQGLMRHSGQAEGCLVHLQGLQLLGICEQLERSRKRPG